MEVLRKVVIALALVAGSVMAASPASADGGRGPASFDRPYYPSIWQGLYAGVHVGFGDADGIVGGGQLGYNWQSGRIVYGVEVDFSLSSMSEEVSACSNFVCGHASASLDWTASVRGRVGYLIDPRILAYATAGFGIASWSAEASVPGASIRLDGTESDFVFGLGVEGKISDTMTARVEYLGFGDLDVDIIRAGLNFRFGN